jgi:hypothetical protein
LKPFKLKPYTHGTASVPSERLRRRRYRRCRTAVHDTESLTRSIENSESVSERLTTGSKVQPRLLVAGSPGAAGSSLLLGSPQLPVRSLSTLVAIQIVNATVHESASAVHASPPPKANDFRKGSKRRATSRGPNQRQFYWRFRLGAVVKGGGGSGGSRFHSLRLSARGRTRVAARRRHGRDGERGGRRRGVSKGSVSKGECPPWSPLHFANCHAHALLCRHERPRLC